MTLTGLQAGQEQKASYQFNISGTIPNPGSVTRPDIPGVGDGPKTDSGLTGGSGGERSNLSTGALVGIIGGVVVVLGVAMFALWRRKRTSSKPARLEQQPHKELPHLPIDQRAPQMYTTGAAPQEYGVLGHVWNIPSQAHSPALQMYPVVAAPQFHGEPSRVHSPALQMYPAVTAPQFYGEPSQAYVPPSPAHVAMAVPQGYGQPSQAYPPPPVRQAHATPEHHGSQGRSEYSQ